MTRVFSGIGRIGQWAGCVLISAAMAVGSSALSDVQAQAQDGALGTNTTLSPGIERTDRRESGSLPQDTAAPADTAGPIGKPQTMMDNTPSSETAERDRASAPRRATRPGAAGTRLDGTRNLRVLSWGGAYGDAQEQAVFQPLKEDFGFVVRRLVRSDGKTSSIRADVVEVDQASLLAGCRAGRFLPLADIALAPGAQNAAPSQDFVAGSLSRCGVGTFAWSALFVANDTMFERTRPDSLSDVFDVKRFPGKRAFIASAPHVVLMTAMRLGIDRGELHAALRSQKSADEIFQELERLRDAIVWVENSEKALDLLSDKTVSIAMSFSGRLFRRAITGPLRPIWDGHVYDFASWAIAADTAKVAQAKTFIAAATMPERMAAQARYWPYGPMRRSAVDLIDQHVLVPVTLKRFLPTEPERLKQGFALDPAFWEENRAYYEARLKAFRDGLKNGIRVPAPARIPARARAVTLPARRPS